MSGPSPERVFLGRALMAVGGLVGGLSGLCTGFFTGFLFLMAIGNAPDPARLVVFVLGITLYYGSIPLGLGGAVFLVGRVLAGAPSRRWVGLATMLLGVAVVAATAYPAAMVTLHGPKHLQHYDLGIDPLTDPMAPAPFVAGLVLFATAIYELRRKSAPPKAAGPD